MATETLPPVLRSPDLAASYQTIYDLLKSAYWEASAVPDKDLIFGAMQEIGEIITVLDEDDIAALTAEYVALKPKIDATNVALGKIRDEVNNITKNIATASKLTAAITKVLSFF